MDFLKGCTTNVHAIENVSQIQFLRHSWKDDGAGLSETRSRIYKTITHLREQNVLCSSIKSDLWIFGSIEADLKQLLGTVSGASVEVENGTLENGSSKPLLGTPSVRDILQNAIEGALAFHLAADSSLTHVGSWTWLYCRQPEYGDHDMNCSMIRLCAKYATNGALYLAHAISWSAWSPLGTAVFDQAMDIVVAPLGRLARTVPPSTGGLLADRTWLDVVMNLLRAEGVSIDVDCEWQAIQLLDDGVESAFMWPAQLCLVSNDIGACEVPIIDLEPNWRHWFANSGDLDMYRHPLSFAQEWFTGAAERSRAANATLQASLDATDALADEALITAGHQDDQHTSPPFSLRNLEQHAAMAGIYPTPPDGLMQSQQNVHANTVTTPSVANAEHQNVLSDTALPSDDAHNKTVDPQPTGEEDFPMAPEDLFGDVGGMEFGDNDIGDADFSFFDERDDEPVIGNDASNNDHGVAESNVAKPFDPEHTVDQSSIDPTAFDHTIADPEPLPRDEPRIVEDVSPELRAKSGVDDVAASQPASVEKPLSPFGIRERLLPPPVPASMSQRAHRNAAQELRDSTFRPVKFRDGFDLGQKYSSTGSDSQDSQPQQPPTNDLAIGLPPIRKKSRLLKTTNICEAQESDDQSESEEDSYESSTSENEAELPPKLSWDSRKRKRLFSDDMATPSNGNVEQAWFDDGMDDTLPDQRLHDSVLGALEATTPSAIGSAIKGMVRDADETFIEDFRVAHPCRMKWRATREDELPAIDNLYDLRKDDLIYVAQIAGEQFATALLPIYRENIAAMPANTDQWPHSASKTRNSLIDGLHAVVPMLEAYDLGQIALTREPVQRITTNSGKNIQGQPRPPQRAESITIGPDYFHIPSPAVKVQRGNDSLEMLPTSLSFWEALGLGPFNGAKDVRSFCVFPGNDDLQLCAEQFMKDIGMVYESCKFGSHTHKHIVNGDNALDDYQNGMAPVELGDSPTIVGALKSFAATCAKLGKALASVSHNETNRTNVVYFVNPFAGLKVLQHLSACFWLLFRAYRDNLPKAHMNQCGSDVVLQIVPISMVASTDTLVVPGMPLMTSLAREVYDRCPPAAKSLSIDDNAKLPILAAPSVELASPAPKRIGFQLTAEPPSHLLHEGSILHLAYARSDDGEWTTASWCDNTGAYHSTVSYAVRGRSMTEIAEDIWERTQEILAARNVTWRLFIVTHQQFDRSMSHCWRSLFSKARTQPLCVTLSTVQLQPVLQVTPPLVTTDGSSKDSGQEAGFPTPASTPQGNNLTSSPDVSGQSNAPPTPAPSEPPTSVPEAECDTHLIDVADETWGALLSSKVTNFDNNSGLANAIIFKRGSTDAAATAIRPLSNGLPSMVVNLHWTMQVKPNGAIDEGSTKQAELSLRELLKMYRNLSLLAKAKALDFGLARCAPLHVATAMLGAQGLNGLLSPVHRD